MQTSPAGHPEPEPGQAAPHPSLPSDKPQATLDAGGHRGAHAAQEAFPGAPTHPYGQAMSAEHPATQATTEPASHRGVTPEHAAHAAQLVPFHRYPAEQFQHWSGAAQAKGKR